MTSTQHNERKSGSQPNERIKVALISCGLGNVKRGFEVSTDRWYRLLKQHPGLDVRLFTGGFHNGGKFVLNIPRDWVMRSPLALCGAFNRRRYWEFCYGVEQISFGLFYWPELAFFRPDVVWTKEVPFGYFLPAYRAMLGQNFKIVFANGGAFRPQTYKDFDYIQHLTVESNEEALQYGIPAEKMTVLTNSITYKEPSETKEQLKAQFGYQPDDYVIICVSAWNAYHKRLDYLIKEVAAIEDRAVKLLLVGHPDAETGVIKELGRKLLGDRIQWRSLSEEDVQRALKACDLFVLASTQECLGNSLAEAVMAGLPAITHSHTASRFILGDDETFMVDLSEEGNLKERILEMRHHNRIDPDHFNLLRKQVTERFSPQTLVPRFYQMCADLRGAKVDSSACCDVSI